MIKVSVRRTMEEELERAIHRAKMESNITWAVVVVSAAYLLVRVLW